MKKIDTTHRSREVEIMDDLEMGGDLLRRTLDQLALINKWLGGNQLTKDGVLKILGNHPKEKEVSIIDFGCGHGDMLRELAKLARKRGYKLKMLGIDANQTAINYGEELSTDYPEISYQCANVLEDSISSLPCDIALCTLFLHHFEDQVAEDFIISLATNARLGVVVNDLHRHKMAYRLFSSLRGIINNHMVTEDGLTSILKSFKRKDLEQIAQKLSYKSTISWRWAFRWQWLIKKK
jgi:2-polyprenyl-3-methyl-5-hydroxy-6-metoxy-1,4-benzoquinol methylase